MNFNEVIGLIKSKNYVVSDYIIKNYRSLGITSDEFIVLLYVLNNPNIEFDVNEIAINLNIQAAEVLELISSLSVKKIIDIVVSREESKISKEYICLDMFYNKLALSFSKKEVKETNIYSIFEKEFARLITPNEYEIIASWIEDNFSEELILEALKEAVYNGVRNLKYIDKILYNWKKEGFKSIEDLSVQQKKVDDEAPLDLFDYDWLG